MKRALLLLLLAPLFSFAQDCKLRNEKDQFNQDPRLTTGFKSVGEGVNKFLVSISADKSEVDVFIALDNSAVCFDDVTRAILTWEGGKSRTTYRNGGTTNCKGYYHFIFKNQEVVPVALRNLAEKKLVNIQFVFPDNTKKDVKVEGDDQSAVMQMTSCVLKELPNLRTDTWKPKQ